MVSAVLSFIACIIIAALLGIAMCTDYDTRTIPNWIPISIFACGAFTDTATLLFKIISLALMILVIVLTTRISKVKSGGGDIKLYCALSFAFGIVFFAAILVLTFIFRWLHILITRKKYKGERFPLCCYMTPAYFILMYLSWLL